MFYRLIKYIFAARNNSIGIQWGETLIQWFSRIWRLFLEVFFKEVNFWPLILDISWVSGGMIALFWRKMLVFGSFVLFAVGKHFWCIWDAFWKSSENFGCISDAFQTQSRKFRSRDMNAAIWFVPSPVPFHSLNIFGWLSCLREYQSSYT